MIVISNKIWRKNHFFNIKIFLHFMNMGEALKSCFNFYKSGIPVYLLYFMNMGEVFKSYFNHYILGIPVYFLYFMNMGKVFANCFKWIYRRIHGCTVRKQIGNKAHINKTASVLH